MSPETKKEKVITPPDFIDEAFIKTLSKEKQEYWENRKAGKAGQGETNNLTKVFKTPSDVQMSFDNTGEMYANVRRVRRRKPPTENQYTKKQNIPQRKK